VLYILHTIKGDSRLVGYAGIATLARQLEGVLAQAPNATTPIEALTELIHEAADVIYTNAVKCEPECNAPATQDIAALIQRIDSLA